MIFVAFIVAFVVGLILLGTHFDAVDRKKNPLPTTAEVGMAKITIVDEGGGEHLVTLKGHAFRCFSNSVFKFNATDCFEQFQRECGKTGLVDLANNRFLPLCKVKEMSVAYEPHRVEVSK